MSNSTIDTETIDFTEGEDFMKALYNERNCVSATWDDFLKLPKSDGYLNNVKRVPNSFSNVTDKKDDPIRMRERIVFNNHVPMPESLEKIMTAICIDE